MMMNGNRKSTADQETKKIKEMKRMFKRKQKEVVEKIKENKILKTKFEVELINYLVNPEGELLKITCDEKIPVYENTIKELAKRNVATFLSYRIEMVAILHDLDGKLYKIENPRVININVLEFELFDKN